MRLAEQNAQQAPRLFLSLAEFLIDTEFSGVDSAESPLALMMFDRHPDIRKEDQITSFVENYPNRTEKGYFLSFADVVVQNVVNEALLNLLKTFGAQEQGLITSNMVSKRLEKVLRRHAAKRSAEFEPADTADQWYEINGRTD